MNEEFWVLMTVVLGIASGCLAQAWLVARAEVARLRSDGAGAHDGSAIRRLEHAVEAVAIEVERIAEHQRYATRLLKEHDPSAQQADVPAVRPPYDR